MILKDKKGLDLKNGFYVGPDSVVGEALIYYLDVKEDSFMAVSHQGRLTITNFVEEAKNFTKLSLPGHTAKFLAGKIEKLVSLSELP